MSVALPHCFCFGSHGSSTNVSKPCARLVPRETSGLAETPTVVIPARLAASAQVVTPSARYPHAASALLPSSPIAPWLRGCSPVNREATDGSVHDDCATACSNTRPLAASRSRFGLESGAAP